MPCRLMPYAVRKTVVTEGQETDLFWEALGGRGEYQIGKSESTEQAEPADHQPQLLVMSEAAPDGVEDLPDYTQADLDDVEIFLLDAFYVVGSQVAVPRPVADCDLPLSHLPSSACVA